MNGIDPNIAVQHIEKRPEFLDQIKGKHGVGKYLKIAMTIKKMDRTQTLRYDEAEFKREFGKSVAQYLRKTCIEAGIKKLRIVKDNGSVYIWSNDEDK